MTRLLSFSLVFIVCLSTAAADDLHAPILLPHADEFVFTLYGAPGEVERLESLMDFLEARGLANGFDPGPAASAGSAEALAAIASRGWPCISYPPFGDFQVKNGRAELTDADEAAVAVFDTAQVFQGIQLGEWGYHFHNLSMNEEWFRSAYGDAFEDYKHLLRNPAWKGYDAPPSDRREAYAALKDYWDTRNKAMRGRNISVTGHSHYEAYAAAWGARLVGLEVGENIAYTQSKFAFARGASRQWRVPWSVQVSPWFHGACTTRGPLVQQPGGARGLDAGHSLNFYERAWLHAWFAGAAMVTPENSSNSFFESDEPPWTLTPHGEKAAELFAFMRTHERGTPVTPIAIVLDEFAGYNAYMRKPWGYFENTDADEELYDLFQQRLFPGSDHIHHAPDPENPEGSYLRPTPYGEIFDVVLSTASTETLASYRALLLAGPHEFSDGFMTRLAEATEQGTKLWWYPRHEAAAGERLRQHAKVGAVSVLDDDLDAALTELCQTYAPVTITGDPVQWQVNRTRTGYVVELVNNAGVRKKPNTPAVVDPDAGIKVTVACKESVASASEWRTGKRFDAEKPVTIGVPPGGVRYVAFEHQAVAR
ncbi:MAG: hypothetical protein GC168_06645 [Candidatus Hydrogenedens sp.]|nr:hypothetical protein [Candidatus Hydrogenedens sp.]